MMSGGAEPRLSALYCLRQRIYLQGLLETIHHSKMEWTTPKRYQDDRSRVMAPKSAHREEHMRQKAWTDNSLSVEMKRDDGEGSDLVASR
jgi:hypothetical protein